MTEKELTMALEGWFSSEAFVRTKDMFKLFEYEFGRSIQLYDDGRSKGVGSGGAGLMAILIYF